MRSIITTILIAAALTVNSAHAQTPDYEAACRLTPACMRLLEAAGADLEPPPARAVGAEPTHVEPVYTDAQIAAAVDLGWNDDLDRIMHSCTANIGGFWNRLGEALNTRPYSTVWWSTPKWRPIAATVTPRFRIRAASAAIRWYTGVVGGSRSSISTGSAAKVRNLCERVHQT